MLSQRPLFALAAVMAACLALAACREEAPPAPAKPAYDFTPLAQWVGKYPHDLVNETGFMDVPALDAALAKAVIGSKIIGLMHERGPATLVEEHDGMIVSWSCESAVCGDRNWTIVATPATGRLDVCFYDMAENGPLMTWYSTVQEKPATLFSEDGDGCPAKAAKVPAMLEAAGLLKKPAHGAEHGTPDGEGHGKAAAPEAAHH